MLKKHMAACLVVTAFAAAPALAQTSTTPSAPTDRPAASGTGTTTTGSPAMQPGASGSSSTMSQSSSTMGQSGGMQGQFMTKMEANQMMASDLIGTRVIGANNESIGDINDVIMDRNGQIMAAVVGVGGFLGIGEKDVAVPFNALEFMNAQQAQAMNNNSAGSNNNVATTGSTTGATTTTGNTATTGAGTAGTSNMTASNTSSNQNQPERVVLRMTKDQLQAAPAFDDDGDNANNSSTGSASPAGTTTAPKQ
ncbi:PRC-barrel domain-containing protein [Microvirga arabica]|uniref:PRC-barrel domain-containing protein n=1 Tax=Microvirga arabica TaxID=1128671 RepID=A0ABV6Y4J7_9HYPH